MTSGIYAITCTASGKQYVGSSNNIKRRLYSHFHLLRMGAHYNPRLQNAWNKYGEGTFKVDVLEAAPVDVLFEREQYWIDALDAYRNGLNLAPYANGVRGVKYTDEQRQHLSDIRKGKPKTESHRRAMAAAKLGKSNGPFGEEARRNMAKARKGNRNNAGSYIAVSPNGTRHLVESLPSFCAEHGLNYHCMYRVSRGKQQGHYGWTCHPVKEVL